MPENIRYEDDDLFNPETHHESTDVPIRPLFWFIGLFIVFGIISHFVLWFMYKALVKGERKRMDPPQTAIARPADASVPQNQPLLQPFPRGEVPPNRNTPVTDMVDMRASEEQTLNNYGWVDKQRGIVRIPIRNAKELFVQRAAAPPTPSVPVPPAGGQP